MLYMLYNCYISLYMLYNRYKCYITVICPSLGTWSLFDDWNGLSSLLGLNLRVKISPFMLFGDLLRRSSISSPLGVLFSLNGVLVSGVFGGLINLPITRSVQGLFFFSFKDKKFSFGVFSGIPKVFQEDVPLSGILLVSPV